MNQLVRPPDVKIAASACPHDCPSTCALEVEVLDGTSIASLVHYMLRSRQFQNPGNWRTRFSWPVEYVVRAVKEVGWSGFSVDSLRTPLTTMGQTLFEPPDVNGWELGTGWFTTGGMLARMNFAATLAGNQRLNLVRAIGARMSHSFDRPTRSCRMRCRRRDPLARGIEPAPHA